MNIKTVAQLEQATGSALEASQHAPMQRVLDRFPVRLSRHVLALARQSEAVARQYLPDPREVSSPEGQTHCFSGLVPTGVEGVERVYLDRCVILPQPACPAYCRFCFRKFYEHADGRAMRYAELDAAVAYVASDARLREVLITGGEPAMDPRRLAHLLTGLRRVPHLGPIRIACRSLITAPELIDAPLLALLRAHQDLRAGQPIEVALHCNHPDELTPATIARLAQLREGGIHVYSQTVLLRGINLDATVLLALLRQLRSHGVETYNLFFGGPVLGTDHLRPTIAAALAIKSTIRERGSGRQNPHLIVTTRLGKVELGVDGWVVERESDGRHVWMRTPYRLETFREMDSAFSLPDDARLDEHGQLVVRYLDGPP